MGTLGMWQPRQSWAGLTGQEILRPVAVAVVGCGSPDRPVTAGPAWREWHAKHFASYDERECSASRWGSWQVRQLRPPLSVEHRLNVRVSPGERANLGSSGAPSISDRKPTMWQSAQR